MVSIIIPTYNRIPLLINAIRSVERQSYPNWELLIVDDFSSDSTESVVSDFLKENRRISYYKNQIKGANNARNYGLLKAKGDWVVFLDSDDELCEEMLEVHISGMKSKYPVQLSVSFSKVYYEYNHSELISDTIYSEKLLLDFLRKKVTWPINAAFIHRTFLVLNGLQFNPNLLNGQDYCFFSEILFHRPSINFIPKILSINHHKEIEPTDVKVSSGTTLKYKLSRLRSRNIALEIAMKKLSLYDFFKFLRYYTKYQLGLIFLILKDGFR